MKGSLLRGFFIRFRKMLIAMFLIVVFCSGVVVGFFNTQASLNYTVNRYISDFNVPDAVISTNITESNAEETLLAIPGIAGVESRLTGMVQFYASSGRLLTAYVATLDQEAVQKLYSWVQLDTPTDDYVLIDQYFAQQNHISIGDEILVTSEEEQRPFLVAAIISAPETLFGNKIDGLSRNYSDIGFMYAPVSILARETEKEFSRMMAEWEERHQEFLQVKQEADDAWAQGEQELAGAQQELESRQAEFEQAQQELRGQIRTLTDARVQLMLGRMELDEAGDVAAEHKTKLEEALAKSYGQMLELEDRQADTEEIRNSLNSLLVRLEDARGRLTAARNRLTQSAGTLRVTLTALQEAKSVWDGIHDFSGETYLPEIVQNQADMTVSEIEDKLKDRGITPESLDEAISEVNFGTAQLKQGQQRIQDGIGQISQVYLPEVRAGLEEAEQGLELIALTRESLKTGIATMEDALQSIADFEAQEPENRKILEEKLQEVEDGLNAIYAGLSEGETALAEGREQLDSKKEEALKARQESEAALSEGEESLNEALEELNAWEGYTPLRNEFRITFEPDVADRQAVLDAAAAALGDVVTDSELYENSQLFRKFRDILSPWDTMTVFIPLVILVLVMMVIFLFSSMIVRQSRREIGVLRALGFSLRQVRGLFCMASFLMMIPALAAGIALSMPIKSIVDNAWMNAYHLPFHQSFFDVGKAVLASLGMVVASQAAILLSTIPVSRIQPVEIISRQANIRRPVSEKWTRILRRTKPMLKMSLLSLMRNRLQFFASAVCVTASVAILFFSMSFIVSKDDIIEEMFVRRIHYDCQVYFSAKPTPEQEEGIRTQSWIAQVDSVRTYSAEAVSGHDSVPVTVMALKEEASLLSVPDEHGRIMDLPHEGIVLAIDDARKLGVQKGDTVTIAGVSLTVAGISRQSGNVYSYCSLTQAEALGEPDQYMWLVRLNGDNDQELIGWLKDSENYIMTVITQILSDGINELHAPYDLIGWLIAGFAVVLGLFIIVNTNQTNLQNHKKELSILRAIGFQRREISLHWFSHAVLYFLISLALGLPLGYELSVITLKKVGAASHQFFYVSSPYQYVMTIGILFLFLLLAHLLSMHSLKKWNLVESVRDKE
ncbi:MAG: FtsX-like permease family protein [Clostridia bacterium]|nr:FtsX-like permease family protein [Clostridia bacterium]